MQVTILAFHPQTQKSEPLAQYEKQKHRKLLVNIFHLSRVTLGFHPQSKT